MGWVQEVQEDDHVVPVAQVPHVITLSVLQLKHLDDPQLGLLLNAETALTQQGGDSGPDIGDI